MEYHDPLNAGLVLPFQCPRDGRSTLPVLPSLPQLGLLRCREPNPRRHHGTPPHLVRLEGVALIVGPPAIIPRKTRTPVPRTMKNLEGRIQENSNGNRQHFFRTQGRRL